MTQGAELQENDNQDISQMSNIYKLILFNDEINYFDHVVDSLIKVCQLTELAAEQVAYIAHIKGKCLILSGSYNVLDEMYNQLTIQKLTVTIEK